MLRRVIIATWVLLNSLHCLAGDSAVDLTVDASRFFVNGSDQYVKKCDAFAMGGTAPKLMRKQRRTMPNGSFVETERAADESNKSSVESTYTPLMVDKSDSNRPAILTYRFSITSNTHSPAEQKHQNEIEQSETVQSVTLNGLLKITARSELSETWIYNIDLAPDTGWSPDRGVLIRTVLVMESDAKGNLIAINGQDYYSNREGIADSYRCTLSRK